ncbi:uncharacterized protein LOC112516521 [Cynara cardunculus var. scolymus]|uniref:uncharacterized protein LOC112516521 n=1 Tax=Cynara cardunculus var. scolymus TaxID=59895 RepID=UPI000D62E6DA|nr:uncharacterized protein LOC112516521 [Cynara cardunculus var. scolymus]
MIYQKLMEQPHTLMRKTNGPIAILWDMENCPVPSDIRPEDVAGNIRMALRVHPVLEGAVNMFSAYGDFNGFPRRLREGCQRTGVKLIDVPNGRKDAADKAILVDMFLFALDNPPPSSIMLISGDVDFSSALHVLGQRGYTVILVIPSGVGVSSALSNAGSYVWDWPSVVRGEGFVPPSRSRAIASSDVAGLLMGPQIGDNSDSKNEEEAIVYRGISMVSEFNTSLVSTSKSYSLPSDLNDVMWVQPGDLIGLKGQLVKLLELSGGSLPLGRLPAEYQKFFGRPLYVSEYGTLKLVNLLKKMSDAISIEGKGQKKLVYLKKCMMEDTIKHERKGKATREENMGVGSSDEFSDDERVVVEERDDRSNENLIQFRYELQELLVSYSCRIFLGCFEAIYQQRYKRPLNYQRFGVDKLEELFEMVNEVVILHEEPLSKMKFLVAAGL